MRKIGVIVADRAAARFFTCGSNGKSSSRLVEHELIQNPQGKLTSSELFDTERATSGTGRGPGGPVGAPGSRYDDHREAHLAEIGRRFARDIAPAIVEFVREQDPAELVLVAGPKFLGMLRPELDGRLPQNLATTELAEELSWQSTASVQDVLAKKGLLPEVALGKGAYRPRGQATVSR